MSVIREALTYARFLQGFPAFLRDPVTVEQARSALRQRVARREESLVHMAERFFYGLPSSPYRPLLDNVGCELGDFVALVKDRGVEGTLRELRDAGVYFTFEEYKGREPVVRNGQELRVAEWQFDNPSVVHYYRSSTSGSTGRPSRSPVGLAHLAVQAELRTVLLDAHGLLELPFAIWRPPLPSGSGLNNILRGGRMGRPVVRWFSPLVPGQYRPAFKYRVANAAAVLMGRLCGSPFRSPEPVALEDAGVIVRFLAETVREHGGVCISTTSSCGLRIGLAAADAGVDLTGAHLLVAGEPATDAKVAGMRASGASVLTDYGAAETGRVALGCPNGRDVTDMHVAMDSAALILHARAVPGTEERVDAINLTTLTPSMPKLLLNMELDDFGSWEERRCGCPIEALGMTQHVSRVRSFRKLVGEGVTLLGSDMVRVLEEVLPARFGGSALSYQLVEDEDERGLTRLSLFVSPSVNLRDEREVVDAMLAALGRIGAAADMARGFWASADSFRVVRREPLVSARGKQMPIRFVRSGTPPAQSVVT